MCCIKKREGPSRRSERKGRIEIEKGASERDRKGLQKPWSGIGKKNMTLTFCSVTEITGGLWADAGVVRYLQPH